MRFHGGARFRSGTYVIVPSRTIQDINTGFVTQTPAVRARFKEHIFDSEAAARNGEWDDYIAVRNNNERDKNKHITRDDVREMVENYLMQHKDYGRVDGRGIHTYKSGGNVQPTQADLDAAVQAGEAIARCLWMEDVTDVDSGLTETVQCEKAALPDKEFCQTHEEKASLLQESPA